MKIKEIQSTLERKNLDFALFYNSDSSRINPNLFYFSGYKGIGALIIPKKQQPFLIAPEMELQRATTSMIKKVFSMEKKKFFESIYEVIKKNKLKTRCVAIDKNNFTLNSFKYFRKHFKKIKVMDISIDCTNLRQIKTNKEIDFLKKSCNYADKILQRLIRNFRDSRTESEASALLEYETKKIGLELSFSPIVASGSNGSVPHHEPSNSELKKGFCVIDFGVKCKGYCSDITRTIYFGKPSRHEQDLYNKLLSIQRNAISNIKLNEKCSEIYDFVVESLGKYKNNFIHGLGHGVGVEIHEQPNVALNSKDRIRNNMVFTIEPGIYFPKKFGIRIEDTVLFKNKAIPLTTTTKDLIII